MEENLQGWKKAHHLVLKHNAQRILCRGLKHAMVSTGLGTHFVVVTKKKNIPRSFTLVERLPSGYLLYMMYSPTRTGL